MTTEDFNKMRADAWLKKFNGDDARILFWVGVKENGVHAFLADDTQSMEKILKNLKDLVKSMETQLKNLN